jgi:rhodanese-related sulfurtransferase
MTWPDSLAIVAFTPTLPEIGVDELADRLDGVTVVDVRQPEEYRRGHVPAARLIPLAEVPDHVSELAGLAGSGTDDRVYLVCRTGARSAVAGEFLVEQGVAAVNVAGGMVAWVEAGHEIVTGDQPT